ncbi:hypothetical protein VSDG_03707 [Cytospora chrysosperma]|uniref:Selenoprotein W-like protein n=1 Tax=Cytospora chrysosperma TaxID=252740 RepID=A0A423W6J1_CYTCH|nr:hypothetical protein VSDG_03707 [Valsa sordida]
MVENTPQSGAPFPLPRVTIKFCTQCKWMLRAAYYAQELLSTFSTSLGEVALQPSTGGTFTVEIFHYLAPAPGFSPAGGPGAGPGRVLWDRKADGGFPETKELKRRVRDVIDPGRDLGHVDRHDKKGSANSDEPSGPEPAGGAAAIGGQEGEGRKPSGAELEAAGQAGGGSSGSSEVAPAQPVGGLQKGSKEVCEDCN